MKNRKTIDAANGVSQLPEAVIQHIQSLLSVKQAAQTSILSKSWHNAWSTRPNLDFDQRHCGRDYRRYCDVRGFLESAKKTIQRYEESNLNIKSFSLSMDRRDIDIRVLGDELTAKALKLGASELSLSVCLYRGFPIFPVTLNACEFRNLKVMRLEWLDIDPLYSDYEFPCLKVLTLTRCFSKKAVGIRISSPSLECLTFAHSIILRATLDVPNIRKFNFSGCYNTLPSLAFGRSASSDWVSDLSFECGKNDFKTSWFIELEKFLEQLSPSKVSFSLEIGSDVEVVFDYARDIWRPKPVVENLTVKLPPKFINGDSKLLECLFGSCETKYVTQHWEDLQRRGRSWSTDHSFLKLVCKTLKVDVSENCCRNTSRLPGLEEVNVECFEETLAKWRPLYLKTLFDASTSLQDKQLIRFRLKWR
ncbi:F-box/LRR-repeat protein at1g52650 [Phtheirospermum japonicum]|uniref:F-box/LRR-repeat protein at1g52650 n=1 Tax=Phtheirospermum japonicum TaxID=374723 RepID=A0A830BWZ3_9LAMI|nr:F-box/LRR-repeat protein at1g52650 [Phtheirospermum japonicum]